MTIFTDIEAAIEEARFRSGITGRSFAVLQCKYGSLKVIQDRAVKSKKHSVMFSTKYDKYHSVLRG
ncbi:hypothetical protein LGZ99_22395 [Photorhabdus temperata]|uniref:Uncharacterized protein n=1 Tax=Photorhabdus temperata subsp. temperata Meg1 TaxID=1393735 RepID=A0A081RR05_PHOTE|nr:MULTISPECIES: hypothetical protein [Photorhabdus]KER01108.1 hypothetical protein MEG1DRAFT_04318 [Photorhabdus temperata subsp. temperata Meg1]MCC8421987.1 hypothetical protein [Photorhabdus thracensis]MCT8349873.1 hypothetical protein [Photorhabdus temperata]